MTKFIVKGQVKYNGKLYAPGCVVEVDEKDVAEFKAHGWEIVGEEGQNGNEGEGEKDLNKLTVAQLTALCEEKGIEIPEKAKKADLIALLQA